MEGNFLKKNINSQVLLAIPVVVITDLLFKITKHHDSLLGGLFTIPLLNFFDSKWGFIIIILSFISFILFFKYVLKKRYLISLIYFLGSLEFVCGTLGLIGLSGN